MLDNENTIISIADVSKIITKKVSTNFTVIDYHLKTPKEIVGFCGDHATLIVHLKSKVEEIVTFFVKLFPRYQSVVEFAIVGFRKEHFVYNLFEKMRSHDEEVNHLLNKCVPTCYLNKLNELFIMDNLVDEGYCSIKKSDYLNYEAMQCILEALAKLHCTSLIHEERESERQNKTYRLINEYKDEFDESYYNNEENFPMFKSNNASITGILKSTEIYNFNEKLLSGKHFQTVLKDLILTVYQLVKPSNVYRNVLCHGDLWATNFMIKEKACKFFDFQCGRYTPPAQDVLSLIYLTTSRDFRKKHLYSLLGFYYSNLEKIMIRAGYNITKIIPFKDFLDSCEEQKVFAMIQAAFYFPLILLDGETILKYFQNSELNKSALLQDRSLLVLNHRNKDPMYDKRIYESILDLKEHCDYL